MLMFAVGHCPLRILAAPGHWPLLPPKAQLALESASVVAWQSGADPSLLATLRPHQRFCELSHTPELPLTEDAPNAEDLVVIQGPGTLAPTPSAALKPQFPAFECIDLALASTPPPAAQVILTRSHEHNLKVAQPLLKAGIGSLSLPTLAFGPAPDEKALRQTLGQLDQFFGVIVSSPRGAKVLAKSPKIPKGLKVAAVGASSAAALQELRLPCHLLPKLAHSEGLTAALQAKGWLGKHWLHLRGDSGREVLKSAIASAGGQYTLMACYQSYAPTLVAPLLAASQSPKLQVICFASGQSYFNYKKILKTQEADQEVDAHLRRLKIISFGPITSQAIQKDGHRVFTELAEPKAELQRKAIEAALKGLPTGA